MRASIPAFTMLNQITSDEDYYKKKVVAPAVAEIRQQFSQMMAAKPESSTEILSALTVAAKTFSEEEYRDSKHKALVILSDMVEESKFYNFRRESVSDKRIDEIIATERAAGRLPSLKGVRVWKAVQQPRRWTIPGPARSRNSGSSTLQRQARPEDGAIRRRAAGFCLQW